VAETKLGLENAAQIRTNCRPVRTAVENLSDEIPLTCCYSSEGLIVRLVLARPGEDERGTVFEHGGKIPAVDTQTMSRTLAVRVEM